MRFILRADASQEIGVGHAMRLAALAEEFSFRKFEVVFVGEISSIPWLTERLKSMGVTSFSPNLKSLFISPETDILVIDSYILDPDTPEFEVSKWVKIVAIVDDFTPKYRAALYIHPGPGSTWSAPETNQESPLLTGTKYIPIRRSLRIINWSRRVPHSQAPRITIFGGGTDSSGFSYGIYNLLKTSKFDFSATLLLGNIPEDTDTRFNFETTGMNLEKLLLSTDLIFTLSGTSSWELLSCGFPIGIGLSAENQRANFNYQLENCLSLGIGEQNDAGRWDFNSGAIETLITSSVTREKLSLNARSVIDKNGIERIVNAILDSL